MQLINIGFGNIVSSDRILAIVSPESAPIKRMVQEAKDQGSAINAACWKKNKGSTYYGFRPYYFILLFSQENYSRQSRR